MTGDEPQGTMGRVQTAVSFPPSFARTSRETSGYEAGKELYYTPYSQFRAEKRNEHA